MRYWADESYSIEEIAERWRNGEASMPRGEVHGYWRVRELLPYVSREPVRSVSQAELIDQGFDVLNAIQLAVYRDGSKPQVVRHQEWLTAARDLWGRAYLVPVKILFRDEPMPLLQL